MCYAGLHEAAFRRHQERQRQSDQPDQVDGSKGTAGHGGHQLFQSAGTDPAAFRWLWPEAVRPGRPTLAVCISRSMDTTPGTMMNPHRPLPIRSTA